MFLAQHVVVHVVGGGYFQTACAELDVHVFILDDRDDAVDQRHDDPLATEMLVLGVVWVDAHGGVAHDGFGAGSGNYSVAVFALDAVAQVIEFAVLFAVDDFFIGEGGEGFRVPIDHPHTAVYQSFVV